MNRQWLYRYRLRFAWGLVGVLLAVLAGREGLRQWVELVHWRELAAQAASVPGGSGMSLERLRQSAQARRVGLAEVQVQGSRWQVRGQVADEQLLQGWLHSLRGEGVQPLQWGLEQGGEGLRFDVVLQP